MDAACLRFMTNALVHLRTASRGFTDLLMDLHTMPHVEYLHDSLLHAWLLYYAIEFLGSEYWVELRVMSFAFGRHDRSLQLQTLSELQALLQAAFLHRCARAHLRVRCSAMPCVSFDGKVNRAVPVCIVTRSPQF